MADGAPRLTGGSHPPRLGTCYRLAMMERYAYLRFLAHNFVAAIVYVFGGIAVGWALGGPDEIHGEPLFIATATPLVEAPIARAAVLIAALAVTLAFVSAVDRRADAVVRAITGTSRSLMPAVKLALLAVGAFLLSAFALLAVWLVVGAPAGFRPIVNTLALSLLGAAAAGRITRGAVRSAGVDPAAAARAGDAFTVLEHLFSANPLGLALGLLGASVFLELGLDDNNVSFVLLFYLPLVNASVDALSWLVSVRLLAPILSGRRLRPGLDTWLPYGGALAVLVIAMPMLKAAVLISGAVTYNALVGGNHLPWRIYADAFAETPITNGFAVLTMLAMAALGPAVCVGILTISTVWRSAHWPIAALERLKRLA
jgi:hypothetical protein